MLRVSDLMAKDVETIHPEEDLDLAAMVMRMERLRHLPVVVDGQLLGLISDRDVLRAQVSSVAGLSQVEQRCANMRIRAGEVMTRALVTVSPKASAVEAAELLREHRISCLPVVEEGKLVGIITATDFLGLVVDLLLQ